MNVFVAEPHKTLSLSNFQRRDAPSLLLFFVDTRRRCGAAPAPRAHARGGRRRRALRPAHPASEAHGPTEDEQARRRRQRRWWWWHRRRRRNVVDVCRWQQQWQRPAEASALAAHVRCQATAAAAERRRYEPWQARRGPKRETEFEARNFPFYRCGLFVFPSLQIKRPLRVVFSFVLGGSGLFF